MTSPEGKILRWIPQTGPPRRAIPFLEHPGCRIRASGLRDSRNPFRALLRRADRPDVHRRRRATRPREEINIGAAGANYGWPNAEGPSNNPAYTNPVFSYPQYRSRLGRRRRVRLPRNRSSRARYQGSYFYADYAEHWIRRPDVRRQWKRHRRVQLRADRRCGRRALSATSCTSPKGPRARCTTWTSASSSAETGRARCAGSATSQSNQPPDRRPRSATPTSGAGTPVRRVLERRLHPTRRGTTLTYSWDFGDGATSTAANPTHAYATRGSVPGPAHGLATGSTSHSHVAHEHPGG